MASALVRSPSTDLRSVLVQPYPGKHEFAGIYYIHNAIRYDLTALDLEINACENAADHAHFKDLLEYWNLFNEHLTHHHHTEDEVFFPYVLKDFKEKLGDFIAEKDNEHEQMAQRQRTIQRCLELLSVRAGTQEGREELLGEAKENIHKMRLEVIAHLTSEEDVVIPVLVKETKPGWGKKFHKKMPMPKPSKLGDVLSYLLMTCDEDMEKKFLNEAPAIIRFFYKAHFKPSFIRRAPKLYRKNHNLVLGEVKA
eukprot:TRINITY_DN23094_c0_g1_i1.p1 TRINITY_DN23094_c0_g1~~TRINITY_DN23094_c0_g1_i1.p1  ORF type:complete len:275 (-),score=57.26 TRINITY_DN23094_c0_g1_i1:51-809(-)